MFCPHWTELFRSDFYNHTKILFYIILVSLEKYYYYFLIRNITISTLLYYR